MQPRAETTEVCEQLHHAHPVRQQPPCARATAERYQAAGCGEAAIDDLAVTLRRLSGLRGHAAVCARAQYDSAFTFIFSPVPARAYGGDFRLPAEVARRFDRLRRSSTGLAPRRVGGTEEVLVEGPSKRDPDMLSGRTRQGKLVHFAPIGPGPSGTPAAGALARVTITAGHPHHLSGRLNEVTARPRHRVLIPVATAVASRLWRGLLKHEERATTRRPRSGYPLS